MADGPGLTQVPWLLAQTALDVLAVQVPVPEPELAAVLPSGVVPDVHDGTGWVTVVAMRMVDVHPRWLPSVPGVSSFEQVGVRAFARSSGSDEPGVAFLALDVSHRLVASVGRVALGIPYAHAPVQVEHGSVRSERLTAGWRATGPTTTADPFFSERDVLFSVRRGRTCRSRVRHPAEPVLDAAVDGDPAGAVATVGLTALGPGRAQVIPRLPSHVWLPRRDGARPLGPGSP